MTFDDRLDRHVDDLAVELHHLGTPAHTTNDVVAWIPERKVLFAGDLVFNGGTPFVLMGSVAGSLVALVASVSSVPTTSSRATVALHGEAIDAVGGYLCFVLTTAATGTTPG